jgi:hypothetical protein
MYKLSEDAVFTFLGYLNDVADATGALDIGGTNGSTAWVPMADFARVCAYLQIGATWNAADDLDQCKLEQAQDASGTGKKDLSTSSATGDYDTDTPIDAPGNFVVLEADASALDVDNGFTHVRLYVAEGGNTGVDLVAGVLVRYGARHKHPELQGAAVAGEKVYATA